MMFCLNMMAGTSYNPFAVNYRAKLVERRQERHDVSCPYGRFSCHLRRRTIQYKRKGDLSWQLGFLAGYDLPASLAVNVDVYNPCLTEEGSSVGGASRAPEAGDYGSLLKNPHADVGSNKAGVLDVGILDRSYECGFVQVVPRWRGPHEII